MDKKFFRHFNKNLQHINVWFFLVTALVSGLVCVVALRNNNLTALKLRDTVIQVDKDNGDIEAALRQLREFMYAHMNTNLSSGPNAIKPPIQLKYRYDRLVKAEQDRLAAENDKLYTEAQAECERQRPTGVSRDRVPCVTAYISARSTTTPKAIPDSLYKFDFVSPTWSPDLAGWSLAVASVSFALFVIRFGLERWTKAELRDL